MTGELTKMIRKSLWNTGDPQPDWNVYRQMRNHTIETLAAPVLTSVSMSDDLRNVWKEDIIRQVFLYEEYLHAQAKLPLTVPYVILKGTEAARYYPYPEYRAMGDIDIMTAHEDYDAACEMMMKAGYEDITSQSNEEKGRHREFRKNGLDVEIHAYFAYMNDPVKAKYFDDLVISHINPTHALPDAVNGLVLLEHINQHLEVGIGLRQIIDWMMFVNQCLPDEKWPEFQEIARKSGMEKLAIVTTRMCEIYLGLPPRKWCEEAGREDCDLLMEYVVSCGNFGVIRANSISTGENILLKARTPKAVFSFLQERGLETWAACRRHPFLRPFAWIYQAGRCVRRGLFHSGATAQLKEEYRAAHRKTLLFDTLEVKQKAKGVAEYRDGEYVKTT